MQKTFKKFSEEVKLYGESVKKFRSTRKGQSNLDNQYKKVMELYKKYAKLATEENLLPPPPPPPHKFY